MYSRKFGQNGLPPDYSGVSFRRELTNESPSIPDKDTDYGPACSPRYPTEDRNQAPPLRKFKVKRPIPNPDKEQRKENKTPARPSGLGLSALASHSFTMEDIVLAGLILLLLNSDCDSELLLVLGFLLLVGLQ